MFTNWNSLPIKASLILVSFDIVINAKFEHERASVIGGNVNFNVNNLSNSVLFHDDAIGIAASRSLMLARAHAPRVTANATFPPILEPLVL